MKELQSGKSYKKPNPVKDAKGLSSLVSFMNDARISGAVVPKEPSGAVAITEAPIVQREPTPEQPPAPAPTTAPISLNKIALTGRLMSGKDYVSERAGLKVFSIASPLYALQKLFFGTDDKTLPGAREFLQTAGQIGRGELSAALPLSIERANFIALVREYASRLPEDFSVDWPAYGRHENLWLDAMLLRVKKYLVENPGARVAVTNARFSNELARLTTEGFTHFHCMCSALVWSARLQKASLSPESPACKDVSEQLAASLDQNVIKTLSKAKNGPKLRCVWSDEKMSPPSGRLLTVAEFTAMFPKI